MRSGRRDLRDLLIAQQVRRIEELEHEVTQLRSELEQVSGLAKDDMPGEASGDGVAADVAASGIADAGPSGAE